MGGHWGVIGGSLGGHCGPKGWPASQMGHISKARCLGFAPCEGEGVCGLRQEDVWAQSRSCTSLMAAVSFAPSAFCAVRVAHVVTSPQSFAHCSHLDLCLVSWRVQGGHENRGGGSPGVAVACRASPPPPRPTTSSPSRLPCSRRCGPELD